MKASLKQAHACGLPPSRTVEHIVHQASSDSLVLPRRIDRDRPDAHDKGALVEKVAANDTPVRFGHDGIEPRMRKQHRH